MATAELLQSRIQRITDRIERLADKRPTDGRLAKIERQEQKLARVQARLEALSVEQKFSTAEVDSLSDSFTLSVKTTEGFPVVSIEAVDSPTDDRFTGGDDLLLRAVASTQFCPEGTSGKATGNDRVIATDAVETQVINVGDSLWNDWASYEQVKLSLVRGDDNEDTLVSETFATADLFG